MADDWEADDWEAEDYKPALPTTTAPASSDTARPNEKEGASARAIRTLDTIDMT